MGEVGLGVTVLLRASKGLDWASIDCFVRGEGEMLDVVDWRRRGTCESASDLRLARVFGSA